MGSDEIARSEQQPTPWRPGERRHLTVVFCDLLGSTAVSAALDPEELSEILQHYQTHVAAAIERFGGTIAQYLGDGVLAYFGYPLAHENDAECAIRAALDIIAGLPSLTQAGIALKVRIGIATGLVVVGQIRETPIKGELLAVGETPNMAARLQAAAPPNGILIAQSTRRLVGGLFEVEGPRAVDVKGLDAPIPAYEVIGASTVDSRFLALRGEATPFIGREEELALVRRRWDQASAGEGRVVLFSGEPGLGKSRILDRACKDMDIPARQCVRLFCSPLHTQSALFPFLVNLKRCLGLGEEENDAGRLERLKAHFAPFFAEPDAAAESLCGALGIAGAPERAAAANHAQRKEAAIRVLMEYAVARSRAAPLMIILEDAHWLDPTSIELIDRLVPLLAEERILIVISARPEYQPVWVTHPSVTLISLTRLGSREAAAVIAGAAGGKQLPRELTEQILQRSDGVPLFLEELTRTLIVSGQLAESAEGYRLTGPLPKVAMPTTLQELLTARLDGLGPVRALAQVGAVIGREFSHELLAAITGRHDGALDGDLARLLASGLVYRRGQPPEAVYFFKHALVQDAAYDTLLKSQRQQLHAEVAQTILATFPALAASQPEVIAHHLTAAEDHARAIEFWLLAGKAQTQASADLEAIDHLTRGIGLVPHIADLSRRREVELKLQTALMPLMIAVKGPFSEEVAQCYARGLELSTMDGIAPTAFPFLYGQFTQSITTGRLKHAGELARRFRAMAEEVGYASGVVIGHRMVGLVALGLGDFAAARRELEAALAHYVAERDDNVTYLFGQNVKCNSQAALSLALYCLGAYDEARRLAAECLETAERLKHPHTMAITICYAGCWMPWLAGDIDQMRRQAERMVTITTEFGLELFVLVGQVFIGIAASVEGQVEAGIARMEKVIGVMERANMKLGVPGYLCALAMARADTGRLAEARATLARARTIMEEGDELWLEPEILAAEAAMAARADPPEAETATALMDEAIARATKLGAPGLLDRARAARARLFTADAFSAR